MTLEAPEHSRPVRVVFIISGLTVGGAELMLWKLLSGIDRAQFDPVVISLSEKVDPVLSQRFAAIHVQCHLLRMGSSSGAMASFLALRAILRRVHPDLVQGWMYYGNIAATLAAMLRFHQAAVLWNIRGTLLREQRRLTTFLAALGGKLSFSPVRIINNSEVSALEHEQRLGYRSSKRVILPNGFDTETFKPSTDAKAAVRESLGLRDDSVLVGLFGRYHPMKDHANLLGAAALLRRTYPELHYVLVGENVDAANAEVTGLIEQHRLTGHVHLLGLRTDVERLCAAVDIAVSSSRYGEGFSNAVGEAMSCAVPCVVTDVGDSAWIVGDTGTVVPPADPRALAKAIADLVEQGPVGRRALGERARQRVIENFALGTVIRMYEALYLDVHREFTRLRRSA